MNFSTLTVHHYGETSSEDKRITLGVMNIQAVVANIEDTMVNGRSVREVAVLLSETANVTLFLNHQDLQTLENAVGAYCLD